MVNQPVSKTSKRASRQRGGQYKGQKAKRFFHKFIKGAKRRDMSSPLRNSLGTPGLPHKISEGRTRAARKISPARFH